MANQQQPRAGGGFNPPEPTTKGGPDYGRFIAAVRDLQDHARTAFLHVDYRAIVPIEKKLQVDAELTGVAGRKITVRATLNDGEGVLTEAHALFVKLKPGQP